MSRQISFPEHLEDVWIYLRKSREDREAEERARGEGRNDIETLSRHREMLLELTRRYQHQVSRERVLEEVVSGEYISERPQMQTLLAAVQRGQATAVWIVDLDRLGRGDMADQGLILRTFKDSETLILTPDKVYDLTDDMDEEWTEFKTFFARRELKMITKRMQRGRVTSVREGKYIGTRPPFGYDVDPNLILIPNEDAPVVRHIFALYVHKEMGSTKIAEYLNARGSKTATGRSWRPESVLTILRNPVYSGWICWRKTKVDRRRRTYRKRPEEEWIRVKGRHHPLIDESTFARSVQMRSSRAITPIRLKQTVASPLTSLIICAKCGGRMVRRPYASVDRAQLRCKNPACNQRSTNEEIVEQRLLAVLAQWLEGYIIPKAPRPHPNGASMYPLEPAHARHLQSITTQLKQISEQRDRLHDLLEQGVYDVDTFARRNHQLTAALTTLEAQFDHLQAENLQSDGRETDVAWARLGEITHILDAYRATPDVPARNALLKHLIRKAVYNKEKWQRGDQFELTVYPLL